MDDAERQKRREEKFTRQQEKSAIEQWLAYGRQSQCSKCSCASVSCGQGHHGYFGPGGWAYERLVEVLKRYDDVEEIG